MSAENAVLCVVSKGLDEIKSLLDDTKEVENNLAELTLDNTDALSWKAPKSFIDTLFSKVSKLKDDFYEKYDIHIRQLDTVKEVPNNPPDNNEDTNTDAMDTNVSPITTEKVCNEESISSESVNNVDQEVGINEETGADDHQINNNSDESSKDINEHGNSNSNDRETGNSVIEPASPDVIDTSIQNNEALPIGKMKEEADEHLSDNEKGGTTGKPFLRLVSLSKLIDPKVKTPIDTTQSILIISSSDEETPLVNGGLKSVSTPVSSKQTKKTETISSKHKDSQKSKQKELMEISDSDVDVRHKKEKNKKEELVESEKNSENDSSDHCKNRKSSRIKRAHDNRLEKQKHLNKIFKRKISKDETDSEDEYDSSKRKNKRKKKKSSHSNETISLSDSDGEGNDSKNGKKSLQFKNDRKFGCDVYIPLPVIKSEDLKTVYQNQKELLEIKKLTNLKTLHKRMKRSDSESTSPSDKSTKDVNKKETKQNKKSKGDKSNSETSADDEDRNGHSDISITMEDGPVVENSVLEDIALEPLRSSEDDTNDNKNQDESDKKGEEKSTTEDESCVDKNSNSVNNHTNKDNENRNSEEAKDISDDNTSGSDKSRKRWKKDKLLTEKLENTESDDKITEKRTQKRESRKQTSRSSSSSLSEANAKKSDLDSDKSDSEDKLPQKSKKESKKKSRKQTSRSSSSSGSEGNTKKTNLDSDKSDSADKSPQKNRHELKKKTSKPKKVIQLSDSENESRKSSGKQSDSEKSTSDERKDKKGVKKQTKMRKRKVLSDSGDEFMSSGKKSDKSSDSEKSNSSSSEEEKKEEPKKKNRRRIKKNNSSSEDEDKSTRKNIRRVIDRDSLSATTKQAEAAEKERKARIAEKQKKYNQIIESMMDSKVENVILEYDEKNEKDLVPVHKHFIDKLKPHQATGVRFMWDACFESLEMIKKGKGGGCILAHCMGLGKTLQVITLAHTLLSNSQVTKVEKVLVVCPVSTVLNWKAEFKMWMPKRSDIEVFELVSCKNHERQYKVREWMESGGVLIIGYTMFTLLTNPNNKKISKKTRTTFYEGLVDPGPDLVVCDEGHLLKNEKTNLSIAMNRIKTSRRIVLTGTPLQNNLKEYWCMVQFIKPNLLGTYKEYLNRFVNPITNGQYTDSTKRDTDLMRKRSHVLHKLLDGIVQRKDYSVLAPYLPPKHEYVLFIRLSEVQVKIYKEYLEKFARKSDGSKGSTSFLFKDFQVFQRLAIHPRTLLFKAKEKEDDEEDSEGSLKDFIDDDDEASSSDGSSSSSSSGSNSGSKGSSNDVKKRGQQKTRVTRAQAAYKKQNNEEDSDSDIEIICKKEWWQTHCDDEDLENINNSGKLFLLFEILKACEEIGDKILVFSQSLFALDCIEYFLGKIDEATQNNTTEKVGGHTGSWSIGLDYFRLDGSSSCDNRANWCNMFNNPNNTRARLFLISTKAGGLGINLVAANRVVIFDVSWNPSHDIQSIYRVYRFGQVKPCYIYRFVTYGAMEMKIYERQVTKQAISKRVIDEQQIDRHYDQNDLRELYKCDLEPQDRPIPMVPKDVLLGEMLQKYDKTIFKYHEHHSLLENKESEELNEEERKAAWEEFENEKVMRKTYNTNNLPNLGTNAQTIAEALASIVRRDNPTWSEVQIRGIIPALVRQLQMQLGEGDTSMFARVQREIQYMQNAFQQQMASGFFNMMHSNQTIQQQHQNNSRLGSLAINPAAFMNGNWRPPGPYMHNLPGPSSRQQPQPHPTDVIDLND